MSERERVDALVVEALAQMGRFCTGHDDEPDSEEVTDAILAALRGDASEPVVWLSTSKDGKHTHISRMKVEESEYWADVVPLYAHPPEPDTSDGIVGRLRLFRDYVLQGDVREWDVSDLAHVMEEHVDAAAAHIEALEAERDRWKQECGPLLDYLTGSAALCSSPVDYARELFEENARLRAIISTGHDHCPYCEHPIMQGAENARLREALERIAGGCACIAAGRLTHYDGCAADLAARALLTDTEEAP